MKNLIFAGASILVAVRGQIDGGECTYAVELLQVQDGSYSFLAHIDNMITFMSQLVDTLHERYGEFKYGVSSFVDKPIPYSGYGNFGGWGGWVEDYCYRHHAPLAEDAVSVVRGLNELVSNLGSGNDFPENPLEALMYAAADPDAQWSAPNVTHSVGGRPLARIAMVITDDIPHAPRDAYSNTKLGWNWPRAYPAGPDGPSTGGFGSHSFGSSLQINVNGEYGDLYNEMADLFSIFDNEGILSEEQEARLDELLALFGPYPWPDLETTHPGDLSRDCSEVEYPTDEQVGDFLRPLNVLPIFLVAQPQAVTKPLRDACNRLGFNPNTETTDCLVEYYKQNVTRMSLPGVVAAIDGDNTLDVIVEAVGSLTNLLCLKPTTTTTTTLPTTSESTQMVTTLLPEPTELSTTSHATDDVHHETSTHHSDGDESENDETTHEQDEGKEVTDLPATDEENYTTTSDVVLTEGSTSKIAETSEASHEDNQTTTASTTRLTTEGQSSSSTSAEDHATSADEEGHSSTESHSSTETSLEAIGKESTPLVGGERPESTDAVETSKETTTTNDAASSTSSAFETADATTEEDLVVIIPPPPVQPPVSGGEEGGDGPGIGVIAGAAGGAVAGVAALAGLAYAKFGAGLFGGSAPAGMEGIQQVEVPESPMERETMEEVTMDMFQ